MAIKDQEILIKFDDHDIKTYRAAVSCIRLEKKSVAELLREINEEDKKVPLAIEKVLPAP